MKSQLKPLSGKYYGTIIEILEPDAGNEIKVWFHSDDESDQAPSERELEARTANDDEPDTGGGHYENRLSCRVALAIMAALGDEE